MDWVLAQGQIFGGCCCNVYLFEQLLTENKRLGVTIDVGSVVTFCQFALVALVSAFPLLDLRLLAGKRFFLQKPVIPLRKIFGVVIIYFTISILNNSVWRFGLSVPVHILFRSSGTVITMVVSYLFAGVRYSGGQVMSAVLMTVGIVLVIAQKETATVSDSTLNVRFFIGIALLTIASVLSAFMGIYTQNLYRRYGNHWREVLFYNHLMGLPMFAVLGLTVFRDLGRMWNSEPKYVLYESRRIEVLKLIVLLGLNAVTQVICARGVNQLTAFASPLTVTVILNARKFVSLAASAYTFGSKFNSQGILGSVLVILGTLQYSISTMGISKKTKKE